MSGILLNFRAVIEDDEMMGSTSHSIILKGA